MIVKLHGHIQHVYVFIRLLQYTGMIWSCKLMAICLAKATHMTPTRSDTHFSQSLISSAENFLEEVLDNGNIEAT